MNNEPSMYEGWERDQTSSPTQTKEEKKEQESERVFISLNMDAA